MALTMLLAVGLALTAVDEQAGALAGFGLACAVPLIVSPIAWTHYYSILLPALVFLPYWMLRQGLRTSALLTTLVPGLLVATHFLRRSWAGPIGLLGIGITIWYFAAGLRILVATAAFTARVHSTIAADNSAKG
jgi:hypothetical protein